MPMQLGIRSVLRQLIYLLQSIATISVTPAHFHGAPAPVLPELSLLQLFILFKYSARTLAGLFLQLLKFLLVQRSSN